MYCHGRGGCTIVTIFTDKYVHTSHIPTISILYIEMLNIKFKIHAIRICEIWYQAFKKETSVAKL
jgi:hypothetical protein